MKRMLLVTLLVVLSTAVEATAQTADRRPRLEIGGSAGLMAALGTDSSALATFGPRLSLNLTRKTSVDLLADVLAPLESHGFYGIYTIQVRHVLREAVGPSRAAVFITGGAVGLFEYERVPEYRQARRDGSVLVYEARTEAELGRPTGFSAGLGMKRILARYAAFVADAQVVMPFERIFVVRGALGVSVPIGRSYARGR